MYTLYHLKLSDDQKSKIATSISKNSSVSIKLTASSYEGTDGLLLTQTQINKILTHKSKNSGFILKLSKTQLQKTRLHGGSFMSIIADAVLPLLKGISGDIAKATILPVVSGVTLSVSNVLGDKIKSVFGPRKQKGKGVEGKKKRNGIKEFTDEEVLWPPLQN